MPKPPSLDHLRHSSTHQRHWPKRVLDNNKDEIIPDSKEAKEESENEESRSVNSQEPAKKRVKRNSTCHYMKPTQLRFYPSAWQDVLKWVKEFYRLWVIKDCPFPVCECHLLQARLCLEKAMEEFEKKGCEVKTSMSKYTFISHPHEYNQVILMSTSITCFFWSVIYFTIDFIFHLY